MISESPISSLLIDLDGTLVDSLPDLADAVNAMLSHFSLPACGEADVLGWVGKGADRLVQHALIAAHDGAPGDVEVTDAYLVFIQAYERRVCVRSKLYPGVMEALTALRAENYRLACVTNKPYRPTVAVLQALEIAGYFSAVVGGDSLPCKKPDPAVLRHAARCLDTPIEACIMVGDSVNDVEAARAAGIEVVCVSYGYNHGQDIGCANPDVIVDTLTELPDLLKRELERRDLP